MLQAYQGIDNELRRYFALRYQGRDERSTQAMLTDIQEHDPDALHQIVRQFTNSLDTEPDTERVAWRQRIDEIDDVYFTTNMVRSGVPQVVRSFDEFDRRPNLPQVGAALALVLAWTEGVAGFPNQSPAMLTLTGSTGTGKTHLAIAAAQAIEARGDVVIYREEAALIGELMNAIKTKEVEPLIGEILDVPYLIIDDLGLTALGDWGRSEMDRIINHRWEQAGPKRTLFTTNLKGDELPARIGSRLRDVRVGASVSIGGVESDYRRFK